MRKCDSRSPCLPLRSLHADPQFVNVYSARSDACRGRRGRCQPHHQGFLRRKTSLGPWPFGPKAFGPGRKSRDSATGNRHEGAARRATQGSGAPRRPCQSLTTPSSWGRSFLGMGCTEAGPPRQQSVSLSAVTVCMTRASPGASFVDSVELHYSVCGSKLGHLQALLHGGGERQCASDGLHSHTSTRQTLFLLFTLFGSTACGRV